MSSSAAYHTGQDLPGAVHKSLDVCIHHVLPFVQVRFMGGLKAQGQSGVIYQDVHFPERFRQV